MDTLLVPSSIQRIRSFLVEMCGMKVRPWATAEETLEALHATLVARRGCDIFWSALRTLLETLARDLKARQEAAPGVLVDNEILSAERYASLLDEIRACLATQPSEARPGAFRQLAQGLTAPAVGLLLLLGGATTVGCEASSLHTAPAKPDAAMVDSRKEQPEIGSDTAPDLRIVLPDLPPASPDLRPSTHDTRDAVNRGPDGGTVTLRDIMDSCNISSSTQGWVLACLAALHESWTTGVTALLAGKDCDVVSAAVEPCSYASSCSNVPLPSEFDGTVPRLCAPVLIYMGVRFV